MAKVKVVRKFDWIIQNLSKERIQNIPYDLTSEEINIDLGDNMTKWLFKLKIKHEEGSHCIGIYLQKVKADRDGFKVNFSIMANNGNDLDILEKDSDKFNRGYGWPCFFSIEELFDPANKYIDEKSNLKVFINLELFYPCEQPDEDMPLHKNNIDHFNDPTFADFTIKSSDEVEFSVHRLILAENSSFFNKMFTIDMQEKIRNTAIFEDNSVVLKEALMFIYSGKADINDYKMAIDVLDAAERFDIPRLKKTCIDKLYYFVDGSNVLEILASSDKYNSKYLEDRCLEYIVDNYRSLGEVDWKSLDFSLIKRVMDAFAAAQESSHFTLIDAL